MFYTTYQSIQVIHVEMADLELLQSAEHIVWVRRKSSSEKPK